MKKVTALLLVLAALCLLLPSCKGNGEKKEIRIGIAAPDVTHGWIAGVAYYAEKYCEEHNLTYKITTSSDAAEMMQAMNDLVGTWGASVLITWPQWTGMEDTVSEIIEQGIPVVGFDIDINAEGIYKVSGDNRGMGYESAKYIVDRVGNGASILVFDIPSAGSIAEMRKQGFYDYLDEIGYDKSNIFEVSETGFGREIGLRDMTDVLESHPHIDAVFSIDDENSIGIIQAITEAGRNDVRAITGGGGMQEYFKMIADPKYESLGLSSALYSPAMVEDAIKSAVAIYNGEEVERQIVVPTKIVTKENVNKYIDDENKVY